MSMKSQLRVLYFQHLKNGMPLPSGFHGFSRHIHSHWITLFLLLLCCFSLIAFKTFILYYSNLIMMFLDMDFSRFILFWIYWASWICVFISFFYLDNLIFSVSFTYFTFSGCFRDYNIQSYLFTNYLVNIFPLQVEWRNLATSVPLFSWF